MTKRLKEFCSETVTRKVSLPLDFMETSILKSQFSSRKLPEGILKVTYSFKPLWTLAALLSSYSDRDVSLAKHLCLNSVMYELESSQNLKGLKPEPSFFLMNLRDPVVQVDGLPSDKKKSFSFTYFNLLEMHTEKLYFLIDYIRWARMDTSAQKNFFSHLCSRGSIKLIEKYFTLAPEMPLVGNPLCPANVYEYLLNEPRAKPLIGSQFVSEVGAWAPRIQTAMNRSFWSPQDLENKLLVLSNYFDRLQEVDKPFLATHREAFLEGLCNFHVDPSLNDKHTSKFLLSPIFYADLGEKRRRDVILRAASFDHSSFLTIVGYLGGETVLTDALSNALSAETLLFYTASSGRVENMRYIMQALKEQNVNIKFDSSQTQSLPWTEPARSLLGAAATSENVEMTKFIIESCFYELNLGTEPALFHTCDPQMVRYLLSQGISPLVKGPTGGNSALHRWTRADGVLGADYDLIEDEVPVEQVESYTLMVGSLSSNPSLLSTENDEGQTPLELALQGQATTIVKCLVEGGAALSSELLRISCGSLECSKYLHKTLASRGLTGGTTWLDQKAFDFECALDRFGETQVYEWLFQDRWNQLLRLYCERSGSLGFIPSRKSISTVARFCEGDDGFFMPLIQILADLLAERRKLKPYDNDEEESGWVNSVVFGFIEEYVNSNAVNSNELLDEQVKVLAHCLGSAASSKFSLNCPTDPECFDYFVDGEAPDDPEDCFSLLSHLIMGGYGNIDQFLKALSADRYAHRRKEIMNYDGHGDRKGMTPLKRAIEYGKYSVIADLLKAGADPNLHDPLLFAIENGADEGTMVLLLTFGAIPTASTLIGCFELPIPTVENALEIFDHYDIDLDVRLK